MFEQCLKTELLPILDMLVSSKILSDNGFYLAGGTALALQFGHRLSEDLDFFTIQEFKPETIINRLQGETYFKVINQDNRTLNVLINAQRISFFHYPYKTIRDLLYFRECPIASYNDIAAMKIIAIAQRGSKKDFVDFSTLLTSGLAFSQMIEILKDKYPNIEYNLPHLIRSIGYFEDADGDLMPVMYRGGSFSSLTPQEWEMIKAAIINIQKKEFALMTGELKKDTNNK